MHQDGFKSNELE